MDELTKRTQTLEIGHYLKVELITDVYEGQKYDTDVRINGNYFMTIAGNEIENFKKAFRELHEKFHI